MKRKLIFAFAFIIFLASFFGGVNRQLIWGLFFLLFIGVFSFKALASFKWKFWFFPFLFVFLLPFTAPESSVKILGVSYEPAELLKGFNFIFHAYNLFTLLNFITLNFTTAEIVVFFEKCGAKTLGLRVALAIHVSQTMRLIISQTYETFGLEYRGNKEKIKNLHILLGAVIRNCASCAENISVLFFIRKIKL